LADTDFSISSFAEDLDGELYVIDHAAGRVHQLQPMQQQKQSVAVDLPRTLSATGCFDPADARLPSQALIPYDVNSPLWSDGATKERWFAIPDGTTVHINADGDWDLPRGSVAVKTFWIDGRRVETRLLVLHDDGEWGGYSYRWNAAGTDAELVTGSDVADLGNGRRWYFPSRSDCLRCHTMAAGRTLGLETAQLNRVFAYPNGRTANQVDTLAHIGLFDSALPQEPAARPALPDPTGSAFLTDRVRSYLHVNCSGCHRPGGTGRGDFDLRYGTPFPSQSLCNATPEADDFDQTDARIVAPTEPTRSVLSLRMHATDSRRMPPLGVSVTDRTAVAMIDNWITRLLNCLGTDLLP
jgi:uncharacterized repeat protein (TIGR03806 family)